ncbi:MAG: glucoamylase family protein [Ferruginibacter sp.]
MNGQKTNQKDILELLPNAVNAFKKNIIDPFLTDSSSIKYPNERPPLRAELFTEQQLEEHAKLLAKRHTLLTKDPSEGLLKRLAENENILLEVYTVLTDTIKKNIRIVPAAEWLLDNFYLIEEQIYTAKKHLPKGYSKGLPQLLKGVSAGLPRVYDIAVEIISHSDGHIDQRTLYNFINAYQTVNYLKIGELWAIPIMLRLALIENLRRLSIQISVDISNKSLSDYWAELMIEATEKDPKNLVLVIADMARSEPPTESSFVSELTRRLQEKGNALSLPLSWLEQYISENGLTTSDLIQQENQKQAADQVSISNSISSLRFLSTSDWREFVESVSIIEKILQQDPLSTYAKMDFATRDMYRHAVEKIAKQSEKSEQEIAALAVTLAEQNASPQSLRHSHVGYYLVDKGLKKTTTLAGIKQTGKENTQQLVKKFPLFVYVGSITLLSILFTWLLLHNSGMDGRHIVLSTALGITCFIASSQFALSVINWVTTLLSKPALLPRMDFSKGIPVTSRTMVVIPTLLTSFTAINDMLEGLEVRFISNRDDNIYFALLTDFKDAATETMPDDQQLLNVLIEKINELNKKYPRPGNDAFYLFHRPRLWNAKDKIWMGYERKRGKLGHLNELLRSKGGHYFSRIIGHEEIYSTVKYIITLDTDTQLPRDVAWKLCGTMAHPLNSPVYSVKKKRITEGYSILQPRVSNSMPGEASSIYARMHSNEPGTDPYTRAISDVYQDLFKEGSFIGKGIYEIDAFEKALKDRFPDNRILSHDLLEGSYSRAGLVTDVQLYEEYPAAYLTDMTRRQRWIRGDWQIAAWASPFVPAQKKGLHKNPVSLLSGWKIFDNLRRSLVPQALLLLLFYGWIIADNPVLWTMTVIAIVFLPAILNFFWQLGNKPNDVIFFQHFIFCWRALKDSLLQNAVDIICLPYAAYLNTGAILKTLWRLYISRKNLLQWLPSQISPYNKKSIRAVFFRMWFAPFFSLAAIIAMQIYFPDAMIIASPILAAWFIAPFIAWFISQPGFHKVTELSNTENIYLRKVARRIWLFFDSFVVESDNWLPPDNYQEEPAKKTAHRTSPTNIGLALLANVTAWDFGYITIGKLVDRTGNTISTMQGMEKYKGHLYNWYDTETLAPLQPKYISTVDSGNLMGHLITLKQALLTLPDKKIITGQAFEGLLDTVRLLEERITIPELESLQNSLEQNYAANTGDVANVKKYLDELEAAFANIFIMPQLQDDDDENELWAEKIFSHIKELRTELVMFVPWLLLPPVPEKFQDLLPDFPAIPTLMQLSKIEQALLQKIISCYNEENTGAENEWLNLYRSGITESGRRAKEILLRIGQLVIKCNELAQMEYEFLYDRSQHLLSIGYNADENRRDNSYYDLLASESRLTTFTAIAQGKLPQESWFALGRQLTNVGSTPILLSWSGSMFEYLMPLLVMPTYENTLLDQTNKAVVQKQIDYGRKKNIPWGISESGYNLLDTHLNWQYRAFGVPGIGFKRGLGEDLVISPYSTLMSLMVSPLEAYENLITMKDTGFEGRYGFYEAVDYTKSRLQRRQNFAIIKSFMSHHQGMAFLSLSYQLHNKPMQERFAADVQIKSALLLLQERIPRVTTFYSPTVHSGDISVTPGGDASMRVLTTPATSIPEVQLLSNGRYDVMITNAGGGYSKWKDIALTRWREDATCDDWGTFCFIRDIDNNEFWSAAYQPALQAGSNYEAVFSQGRAEFRRRDFSLETHTEIVVSPEDDIELRRVHISNKSRRKRIIEITSYAEVVLTAAKTDEAHPAFSNLFIQTAINKQKNSITCTRRPRSATEVTPCMFHLMKVHDAEVINISYETNRSNFIGRGNSIHTPQVMNRTNTLTDTEGSVLDPIISIRYRIVIEPLETVMVDLVFGAAETLDTCNFLIDKYQDRNLTNRVLELAWTHSQVILRQINAIESDAQLYARLASSIIFANPSLRTDPSIMIKNNRGQSGLWSYSISGDLPIVLLQIEDSANIDLVRQMIQAHTYWRFKGLAVDLVIWNEDNGGYRQLLLNQILSLIAPAVSGDAKDKPGGIFIRSADQISNEDRILFQTVARVIISDKLGTLEEQINRRSPIKSSVPFFSPVKFYPSEETTIATPEGLQLFNGHGGFSPDGKEYIITTTANNATPAPWINILANANFGSIVSESGQSYSWIENAHEFRLTPWNNDPVSDLKGEAFYLRDEESGRFWSPSPLPCRGKSLYTTTHGFGYSIFNHSEDGIESSMTMFTHIEAPVKFITIKLRNTSSRVRRISATGYVEWVLGDLRSRSLMHIVTEMDVRSGAVLARNPYNSEFENRVAFFDVDDPNKFITTDRTEFIGRNGTMANPDAMSRAKLSGKKGAGFDPCAALQVVFDLAEDEEREIIFRLGAGKNTEEVLNTIKSFEGSAAAKKALEEVRQYWNKTLGAIQINTPDAAINILANGWLTYQTLACRIWARSGFYQSGGAFGYRDQLQDVISLLLTEPALARQQILLCASRQFKEGDVQHWWHPPVGRGVRTTCSDDYLWLPFVTSKYVSKTGDGAVLNEVIFFLESRLLNAGEESSFDLPIISDKSDTLYQHCVKAIEHALKFGEHGLPFMGSGDWNDGMDKVGEHGKGESVWLAFFLYDILIDFIKIAQGKNDTLFAEKCRVNAKQLRSNINKNAWDGGWYRRAYFDDGTPLGSAQNEECKIDSIAQSWSVISGAGEPDKLQPAMNAAYEHLVRKEEGLIQLFEPPFDKGTMNPGYIKGYVPGVRENGGQYTHAAIWLIMGFAALGNRQRTWELLNMINPLNHGNDARTIAQYKVEPYVMAADVYAESLHKGRGGWTWYTGSAGWMYQLITESFMGIKKEGDKLYFKPCLPPEWPSAQLTYRHEETIYSITIKSTENTAVKILVDGVENDFIQLVNDGMPHVVEVF